MPPVGFSPPHRRWSWAVLGYSVPPFLSSSLSQLLISNFIFIQYIDGLAEYTGRYSRQARDLKLEDQLVSASSDAPDLDLGCATQVPSSYFQRG